MVELSIYLPFSEGDLLLWGVVQVEVADEMFEVCLVVLLHLSEFY